MRARRLTDERGIALAVAVFALVVIGALVAGTFFSGRLELLTGRNTFIAAQAAEAAESGLTQAAGSQTTAALLALPINANPVNATSLGAFPVNGAHTSATASINRLTDVLFLVRSVGVRTNAAGGQLAARSLGQLIRLVQADIESRRD